jgi:hypothetical protein
MSRIYDAFKTSKDAEQNGVWINIPGGRFKLARMGGANLKFQRALQAATRPMMREIQMGLADDAALDKIMRKVFVDTVLLDWESDDDDGKTREHQIDGDDDLPLMFSKDAAYKLFDDLPDAYAQLREQASSYSNYRAAAVENIAKN